MKKILVMRFSSMGDVALTIPPLLSITKQYPKIQIIFLTKKSFLPLFQNIKNLSLIGLNLNEYKGFWGILQLFWHIRKFGPYEKIIDLHNSLRSNLLRFFFLGTKSYLLNKDRKVRKMQTRAKNKILAKQPHITSKYMSVFEKANLPADLINQGPWIKVSEETRQEVKSILVQKNINSQKTTLIAYAPFAAHSLKEFSNQKKQEIVKDIAKQIPNCSLFLLGSPSDKEKMLKLKKQIPNVYISCEIIKTFSQELALIETMNLVLSMDSGNLHLASLLNRPVLGVYGTTHPYSGFYPFNQEHHILQKELDCRPCSIYGNTTCRKHNNECLEEISNQTIIEKILSILNQK